MINKVIELDPGLMDAYYNQAVSLITLGRYNVRFRFDSL